MSAEATGMQDLASDFSKIFRGHTPSHLQREGAAPSRTHPSPASGRGAGVFDWDPNLGPISFSAVVAPVQTWYRELP